MNLLSKYGDQLIDVLKRGQGVLNVLPLAAVKDEVDIQLISHDETPPVSPPVSPPGHVAS